MTARTIPVVLDSGSYEFWSENCQPNGVDNPCAMYDYADDLGCPPCTHFGADVQAVYQNVYAATDARVAFAGADDEFYTPMHVDLQPNKGAYQGEYHIYAHLSWIHPDVITKGTVVKGQLLGRSGTDAPGGVPALGNEHLHWERRKVDTTTPSGERSVDPITVLTDTNGNDGSPDTPVVPEYAIGDRLTVIDGPVNVRATPSLSGTVVTTINTGANACVTDGPVNASGHTWAKVSYQSYTGWVATIFTKMSMIGGCKSFSVGDRLVVNDDKVNIRRHPERNSTVVGTASLGSKVCVVEGYQAGDGYRWYKIDNGRISGWAAATYLNLDLADGCGTLNPELISTSGIVAGDVLNVTAASANLRVSPATGTSVIEALPSGTKAVVVGGPVTASGHTWYEVEAKAGRGWLVSSSVAEVTPTNLLANPGATTNLNDIAAMSANSTVTREAFQGGHVVKVVNSGASTNEGVKYNSGTLSLAGQRGFVGIFDVFGRAKLDQVKVRIMYSDGSSSTYSAAAVATTLSTSKWRRIVTPAISSNSTKTVNRVELWIRRGPAAAQTFYVDNAKIVEV